MSDRDFPTAGRVVPGAFVQLIPDIVLFTPNIILFQYNPGKVTRGLTPWNPFEASTSDNGAAAPDVAPVPPDEKISFELFLDATAPDQTGNPINAATGVAGRIAALRKLARPTAGVIGDIVQSAANLVNAESGISHRPTVPIAFLVFGPGLLLPVRLTKLDIEETMFSAALFPIHAKASVELQVLTPNMFRCKEDVISDLAVAAFNANQLNEDALALANIVNGGFDIIGLVQG